MTRLPAVWLPAAVISVVAGLAVLLTPLPLGLAGRFWMVALGIVAASALIRAGLASHRQLAVPAARLRRSAGKAPDRPPGLAEVERAVDFGSWSQSDLQHRLRPILVEVAEHRLGSLRGIDLQRQPERARAVLGEDLWQLMAAGNADAKGRAPGVPIRVLRSAIEALEAI